MPDEQQRDFFRLVYPPEDRPTIKIEESEFIVADLSEKGVKFVHNTTVRFPVGVRMNATIIFKDKSEVKVTGDIIRVVLDATPCFTVVELIEGVPVAKMLGEQRILIQKYRKEELDNI
jgi:hypothetical protein